MHTNIRHKKISHKCQYCDNTFSDKEDLSMHINIKHRKISHKCENCDNSFSDEEDLKLHMNVKHGNISNTTTTTYNNISANQDGQKNCKEILQTNKITIPICMHLVPKI